MLRLVLANLKYQSRTIAGGVLVALLLATVVTFGLPSLGIGPPPEDDFKLFYFYPVLLVFLGMGLAFVDFGAQRREYRLSLTALLPCTQTDLGFARILTPVFLLLGCMILAVGLMIALQVIMGTGVAAWRSYMLTYFAGLFFITTQFPILAEEVRPALKRSRPLQFVFSGILVAFVSAMLLRALSEYIDLVPQVAAVLRPNVSMNPEVLSSTLLMHGLGWAMVFANGLMFRNRRSLIES